LWLAALAGAREIHPVPASSDRTSSLFARSRLYAVVIVVSVIAVYANTFRVPFLFDDVAFTGNPSIRDLANVRAVLAPPAEVGFRGRPLANLSAAIDHALGGSDVRVYHATNLLIHLAAALTLFAVVRRTLDRVAPPLAIGPSSHDDGNAHNDRTAFAAALLWSIHPLATASVTYLSQRTESLAALLVLLALYGFIRGWRVVTVVACLLGMLTKETAVTAPLVILLYDRAFAAGSFRAALRARPWFYFALIATWLPVAWVLDGLGGHSVGYGFGVSMLDYALTSSRAIVTYLGLAFWPAPLVFDYGPEVIARHPGEVALPLLLVGILLALGVRLLRHNAPLGFAAAVFFVLLAPTTSVVPIVAQPIAENRMYLPLAVVLAAAVIALQARFGRGAASVWAAAAVAFGGLTVRRNADYASELSIWSDTVAKEPGNARAHDNLGLALAAAGRFADALEQHAMAVKIAPSSAEARNNLGLALVRAGRVNEAVSHYEVAVKLRPGFFDAWNNLGGAQFARDDLPAAISSYETALRLRPDHAEAHNNLALALAAAGLSIEAISHYERALQLAPGSADVHVNFATLLFQLGRFAEAVTQYEAALRAEPDSAEVRSNLGITLLRLGRPAEARRAFETALRIDPTYAPAREALSRW
jgi:Flp pilus assembly protein TadD